MKRFLQWWKGQPVLGISLLAALVSMCFVPPDAGYLSYCNRAVLIQLFCLMLTVAGLRSIGVFEQVTQNLLKRAGTVRRVGIFLIQLCFFSAMLVTNDVALLTFVPLTLLLFEEIDDEKSRIWVIVLETAAANLGSMMTPVGNPQNLYLYAAYQLHTTDFFRTMLPTGAVSYALLWELSAFLPKTPCTSKPHAAPKQFPRKPAAGYLLLFVLCLLTVFRVLPDWVCLIAAIAVGLLCNRKLFAQVDYCLLGTFVCFFVFVGNIARIEPVREFFADIMLGRELWISAALSQCISNVPAAVMLSGFTRNAKALLLGVNLGGLGTPIASLASLISYQFYSKAKRPKPLKYLAVFSAVNFGMLAFLLLIGWLQLGHSISL